MHVLISGAGIAGPIVAFFLAKAGIRCIILERAPSLLAQGQNVDLQGSAVKIIEKMGLLDRIRELNSTEEGTQFVTSNGKPFVQMLMKDFGDVSPTSEFEILRGDLASVLYAATKDNPLIEYRFGITVQKVLSNNDTGVEVELDNGKIERYDLLVAADGQWSKIRAQCFPVDWLRINDLGCFVGYWTMPRTATDNNFWNIYFGPNAKILSTRPDPYGTTRALCSFTPKDSERNTIWRKAARDGNKDIQKELFQKDFANAGWEGERMARTVQEAPDFYLQAVQQIKLSKWFVNRVVCVGDAAYAPTSMTGMGTSLAVDGAYALAGELSRTKNEKKSIHQALEAYDREFRPFVVKSQQIPMIMPLILNANTWLKRWTILLGLWAFTKIFAIMKMLPWRSRREPKQRSGIEEDFVLPRYPVFD